MKMICFDCGRTFKEQDRLVVDDGEEDVELCPFCKSEDIGEADTSNNEEDKPMSRIDMEEALYRGSTNEL